MSDEALIAAVRAEEETCRCGHTRDNFWVRPERAYSLMGTFMFVIGVTPKPKWVDIRCSHCGHVFEREFGRLGES